MIKELIFSGKKYYEGNQPNYIGKTIKGVNGTITNWSLDSTSASLTIRPFAWADDYREARSLTASQINGKKILYQVFTHVSYLSTYERQQQTFVSFTINTPSYHDGGNEDVACWVKLNDILKNGGVSSSPLTHLYQGLRHLLDRKVALVND